MRFLYLFCLILLVLPSIVSNAIAVEPNQRLHEYIEYAKTNHPEFRAMSAMIEAEQYRAKMSRGWMNPMFRVGLMNVPSKTLAVDEDPMTMLQASIMQKILLPGQTKRKTAIGNEKTRTREQELTADINTMSQMIRMAYFETAAAKAELAILEAGL
ncbi:MAG: TolC family protein, partial [bacterium]|nr:TolC family protein [bacterium]